jgi:uncharacterized membrane protein YphA (DoxX/SURF4 family)
MPISRNGSASGASQEGAPRFGGPVAVAAIPPFEPRSAGGPAVFLFLGRLFFACSLLAFGIQEFRYSGHVPDLGLVPGWLHGGIHLAAAWIAGALFLLTAIAVLFWIRVRPIALLLSAALVAAAFLRIPITYHNMIQSVPMRTVFFELLSCAAACWILAGLDPSPESIPPGSVRGTLAGAGRWIFAIAAIVYGIGHFQAPAFIASVIPHWIPFPFFWVYFTAAGFLLAGLAMATGIAMRPGAALLGLMFFLWVVLLHAPRIAHALHNGDEWNSGFVALAMSGCALLVAALPARERRAEDSSHSV